MGRWRNSLQKDASLVRVEDKCCFVVANVFRITARLLLGVQVKIAYQLLLQLLPVTSMQYLTCQAKIIKVFLFSKLVAHISSTSFTICAIIHICTKNGESYSKP